MRPNSRNAGTASLGQLDGPGASTRPTSKSEDAEPISTVPSTKREKPSTFLLPAKRDVAAAKAFFRLAFRRQAPLPLKITLAGYPPSHPPAQQSLDYTPAAS